MIHRNPTVIASENCPCTAGSPIDPDNEEPPGRLQERLPLPPQSEPAIVLRFPREHQPRTSPLTRAFRKRFYSGIPDKTWNDWLWQIRSRIRTVRQLQEMLVLSKAEIAAFAQNRSRLPIGITPYYMSLLSPNDAGQPLRRTVVPTVGEWIHTPGETDDPLAEEHQSPVPGLVHRYPDRVLLLVHDFCSTYCRYCTRSRVVGRGSLVPSRARLEKAVEYIQATPSVRDVLISGGDPLTLGDERLEWLLARLRRIAHVEILRIGTKVPAVLPQRITPKLTRMLRKHHPLFMSLHFTHPEECTPEAMRACAMLADAGIPLGSQTVLLQGINDDAEAMQELCHRLLRMRVRPYYLYQCDPISGSGHFRTPVAKGLEIIRGLRGFTSGYAVPTYVIDAPGGGGKIPLTPDSVIGRSGENLLLRNYENRVFAYPDPNDEPNS